MFTNADPSVRDNFALAMKALGVFAAQSVPKSYPWDSLPNDSTIVDVGGGIGHVMLALLRKFPHLKAIVQDMEAAVSMGKMVRTIVKSTDRRHGKTNIQRRWKIIE